jgi:hypothetical protein
MDSGDPREFYRRKHLQDTAAANRAARLPREGGSPDYFKIAPVMLVFAGPRQADTRFETARSQVAFARLAEAAGNAERVARVWIGGLPVPAAGVAALNCYLRTRRSIAPRFKMPFDRLQAGTHRYAWQQFLSYVGI